MPLLNVHVIRRDAVLVLPRLRAVIVELFRLNGIVFQNPEAVRYTTTLNDHDARDAWEIRVRVTAPLDAVVEGKWVSQMVGMGFVMGFDIRDLIYDMGSPVPAGVRFAAAASLSGLMDLSETPPTSSQITTHEPEQRSIEL
jgi:hypothetical protein